MEKTATEMRLAAIRDIYYRIECIAANEEWSDEEQIADEVFTVISFAEKVGLIDFGEAAALKKQAEATREATWKNINSRADEL